MAQLNTILRLRRDNDYNYAKIANKFIPANGEICLVDTARSGLRAICGDGKTPFGELDYIDNIFLKGYYNNNSFYQDKELTILEQPNTNIIYIDKFTNQPYYFDGEKYQTFFTGAAIASDIIPGIMKLYSTTGQNVDGTMTQKAITDELDEKVEIALNIEEELVIFSTN